jgi:hypothetical protein
MKLFKLYIEGLEPVKGEYNFLICFILISLKKANVLQKTCHCTDRSLIIVLETPVLLTSHGDDELLPPETWMESVWKI